MAHSALTLHPEVLAELREALKKQMGLDPLPDDKALPSGEVVVAINNVDTPTLNFIQGYLSGYQVGYRTPAPPLENLQLEQDIGALEAEAFAIQHNFKAKARAMQDLVGGLPQSMRWVAKSRIQALIDKFNL